MSLAKRASVVASVQAVAAINEPLAAFYRQVLAEERATEAAAAAADEVKTNDAPAAAVAPTTVPLVIGNIVTAVDAGDGSQTFDWAVYVRPRDGDAGSAAAIRSVTFELHPTFTPAHVTLAKAPFVLNRRGWGTFPVTVVVTDTTGAVHRFTHQLCFDSARTEAVATMTVAPPTPAPAPAPAVAPAPAPAPAPAAGAGGGSSVGGEPVRRMKGVKAKVMHGRLAKASWRAPLLVTYCPEEARPGYNSMQAHEYQDDPETLRDKVRELAKLLREARRCVAYTGAGISTSSGINDYASKSKESLATGTRSGRKKKRSGLSAEPTFAHFTLTALFRQGLLKHWVQQNHDGLPQKAGFPQEQLNEIHGAWFDPSNPVVPMTGTLRTDLCEWMEREEEEADLVLAMGTSLCGMNADRMVETPSRKAARGEALGAVIVGLQRTKMDDGCTLRFFCKIDELMLLLALELGLPVPTRRYEADIPAAARVEGTRHTFMVPYDRRGRLVKGPRPALRRWSLEEGAKVRIVDGPGKGFKGHVARTGGASVSYTVQTPVQREGCRDHGKGAARYALGPWWVEAACRGSVPQLPFVNE